MRQTVFVNRVTLKSMKKELAANATTRYIEMAQALMGHRIVFPPINGNNRTTRENATFA